MEIQAFGYLGLGASNLDDWATFATSTIGMQSVDRASSMRAFRMDDRKQRLFIDRAIEPGTQVFGWEVANVAALDSLAARLEAAGVSVKHDSRAGRPALRDRPDLLRRPCRQSPGSLPRRPRRRRHLQAQPRRLRFPHRPAGYGTHPTDSP